MKSIYSVSQVNQYIKNMFTQDFMLNKIQVRGEVSNCKYHTSGHIYFSIKDEKGAMACIMFAGQRKGLTFQMKEGMQVVVSGSVNIYERDGKYQLYATNITLDGVGALYERYEALKAELEEKGMFSEIYKQSIPVYARRIGVVTAPTGAAVRDIMNISSRRNPYVQLILYPALVQGAKAAESIAKGIGVLDSMHLDVIIVGRGGGSIEELWAFNEEVVADAIFNAATPIISAVGHETDTTIADYVADLRAPTPSAAAELAVYPYEQIAERMENIRRVLYKTLSDKVYDARNVLGTYKIKLKAKSPRTKLLENKTRAAYIEDTLESLMKQAVVSSRHQVNLYIEQLKGVSPLERLSQGYSYITNADNHNIRSIQDVKQQDELKIRVTDGMITARVEDITKKVD